MRFSNQHSYLFGVILLAMFLRFIWIGVVDVHPVSDSVAYQTFAENLAVNGVYGWTPDQPGAYWPVGTSAILASGYSIFGINYDVVVGLNMIATVGIVLLTWYLGHVYFNAMVARIAVLLISFWPLLIQYTTIISSELFFIFFTLLSVSCWERLKRSDNHFVWLLFTGIAFAAACYVRPIALLLPIALGIAEIIRGETKLRDVSLRVPAVMIIMVIIIVPWSYRNYVVFGEVVPISTNFGANFWMGNNPETTGEYQPLPDRVSGLSETQRSDLLLEEAKTFISENPGTFLKRTVSKVFMLHDRETIGAHWNRVGIEDSMGAKGFRAAKIVPTLYWYCVLLLALIGIVLLVRELGLRKAIFATPVAIWGYVTLIHAIIVVQDRYHSPSIPFIALLASYTLSTITVRLRSSSTKVY